MSFNHFPNDEFRLFKTEKKFEDDNFELDENGRKFSKREKTLCKKEKLLIQGNFSFSQSVFKGFLLQTREKPGLVWERINRQ